MQMFDHSQIEFNVDTFNIPDVPEELGKVLKRTDTGQPLAIVSKDYTPVQYIDIVQNIEEALTIASQDESTKLDLTDTEFTIDVLNEGQQLELKAKFHGQETFLDGGEGWLGKGKSELIIPEFVFRTSHNRTWANNGMMGVWRSKCWNTLVAGNKLAHVYGRHSKNFDLVGFAGKIGTATKFISGDGIDQMKRWYNTPVNRESVISLFKNTIAKRFDNVERKNVGNKVMLSNLMKIFDEESRHITGRGAYQKYGTNNGGTLYNVYNAATYWSSHPSLMSYKNGGNFYQGKDTKDIKENRNTVKLREDKVSDMLISNQWKELEMIT
mgnify:FL=1